MAPVRCAPPSSTLSLSSLSKYVSPVLRNHHQSRSVATTRRFTKANRNAPSATATPGSKYLVPTTATIVFNPPPSAPNPYSTPPLFLPPSDPRRYLLTQSHEFNNPYLTGVRPLPPAVKPPPAQEKRYHLTEQDISEMRRLRKEDPWEWTVPKLAEKFGCSKIFVGIAAPASKERKEWGLALHQRFRDRWGNKRRTAVLNRGKRRELWERDL